MFSRFVKRFVDSKASIRVSRGLIAQIYGSVFMNPNAIRVL